MGDRNIFEARSSVTGQTTVSTGCIFGAGTNFELDEQIDEKMIIYNQVPT